jgi:hypothetical protein
MAERNGLLRLYGQIEDVLNGIETLPKIDPIPLPPTTSPIPAMYLIWDDEALEIVGGDLKWIEPFNARTMFKVWLYVPAEPNKNIAVTLIEKAQLIKDAIKAATANAEEWKGNVVKVAPSYGMETRAYGAIEVTILFGEYL